MKLTKTQKIRLLNDCHKKFLKLFGSQKAGENYVTTQDLDAMLKIINRVNSRLLKR